MYLFTIINIEYNIYYNQNFFQFDFRNELVNPIDFLNIRIDSRHNLLLC